MILTDIKKNIRKIRTFDKITNFRLLNRVIITFSMFILIPIIIDLKGEYLAPWVISSLMIGEVLSAKYQGYFVEKFSLSDLYKLGMGVHSVLVVIMFVYFYDKMFFVVSLSVLAILEIVVFGAFSIKLDVFQMNNFSDTVQDFKIVRNSVVADATVLGLGVSALLSYYSVNIAVLVSLVCQSLFSGYFLYNWNYISNIIEKDKLIE